MMPAALPTREEPEPAEPIRVLYVDSSVGFGGASKSLSLVSQSLDEVESYVLTSQQKSVIEDWFKNAKVFRFRSTLNYRSFGIAKRWVQHIAPIPIVNTVLLKVLAALDLLAGLVHCARIIRIVKRHRIQIVHLNNGFWPFEAMLAARVTGVPCIVHMRGFEDWRGAQYSGRYRRTARAIAVSNAVGTSLALSSIPPDRIITIYDPVDIEEFAAAEEWRSATREDWGISDKDVAVGIFGRVVEWKGQREFVSAALEAMQTLPDLKAVIVGDESDGDRQYFEAVKQQIHESSFADRFVLTGYHPRVAELYQAMDIVVHASTLPEPFGMVVPEGMAASRPIIAVDAGGPREVVTPGVDGLLVPPGDVAAMARAIVSLSRDPDRRRAMGERGHAKVAARFRVAQAASGVLGVYRELLQ